MEREFSAGGVVLRHMDDRWWVALIEPRRSEAEKRKTKHVRALPKGLIDPGEKPAETAVREVREETGVRASLITKLQDIKYTYVRSWGDKQRVFKVVSFYLLRYEAGTLGDISEDMRVEVESAEWVPLEEADKKLSYSGEKQVAKLARDYVQNHDMSAVES